MQALIRISDNMVMDDRTTADFSPTKQQLIATLEQNLADLQPGDEAAGAQIQSAIDLLYSQWEAWKQHRREACAKMFGGVDSGYRLVTVPPEQEAAFLTCRDATIDGDDVLTLDIRKPYIIDGSTITVTKGWVTGNYRLTEDDVTDFSAWTLTAPRYFKLMYVQNTTTYDLSVVLLVREEDEEFSAVGSTLRPIRPVCQGRVNIDNTITEGVF